MDLHTLNVFLTVARERSFSIAAERLFRTQPAVSLAVQRLESAVDEKLLDRSGRHLVLTDAGELVLEYALRFENLSRELEQALAELRDKAAGKLAIGANESTTLYLLKHIHQFRGLYPKVKVEIRRSLSSTLPAAILRGDLELGAISYEPNDERLASNIIYVDRLCFVVSPRHRLAEQENASIRELGEETFIAHNVASPYRQLVLEAFQKNRVPLNMDLEMPSVESIRRMVEADEGVAFLPKMCVEEDLRQGRLHEVKVEELQIDRNIRLIYPRQRRLSYATRAFLDLLTETNLSL